MLPQALLPALSKSVGKVCAVPLRLTYCRLADGTPLARYWSRSASIRLTPTVVSLVPVNRKIFWVATFAFASIALPLQPSMLDCIALRIAVDTLALYMQEV